MGVEASPSPPAIHSVSSPPLLRNLTLDGRRGTGAGPEGDRRGSGAGAKKQPFARHGAKGCINV